jgi:hypothetical protein
MSPWRCIMKTVLTIGAVIILLSVVFSGYTHAGVWEKAKTCLTGEVLAFVATTVLALLGGASGVVFRKISRTFREVGEFMTTLGTAVEDRHITRDELARIIREGRGIFKVWM